MPPCSTSTSADLGSTTTEAGQPGIGTPPVQGSAQVPQSFTTPPVAGENPTYPDISSLIPPQHKDKPWANEVKDVPTLFDMLDNQKTELSKRPGGIPHDNATDADWEKFNAQLGVPDDASKYEFNPAEGQEFTDQDKAYQDKLRPLLQKAGITPRQLAILTPGMDALTKEFAEESSASAKQTDEEFIAITDKIFGDRQPEVMRTSKLLIDKYAPQELRNHIDTLDNKSLATMASVIDGIRKDHIAPDQLPTGPVGGTTVTSEQENRSKGMEIMGSDAYRNPFHPGHDDAVQKVQQLFGTA